MEAERLQNASAADVFDRAYYSRLLREAVRTQPELAQFDGLEHEAERINIVLSICYRNALTEVFGWMWLARGLCLFLTESLPRLGDIPFGASKTSFERV